MTLSESTCKTCKTCDAPIVWGLAERGQWKALEPDPHGSLVLLREHFIVFTVFRSFDDMPASQRATIPEEMRDVWKDALDGPRYKYHDRMCAYISATRINAKAVL